TNPKSEVSVSSQLNFATWRLCVTILACARSCTSIRRARSTIADKAKARLNVPEFSPSGSATRKLPAVTQWLGYPESSWSVDVSAASVAKVVTVCRALTVGFCSSIRHKNLVLHNLELLELPSAKRYWALSLAMPLRTLPLWAPNIKLN